MAGILSVSSKIRPEEFFDSQAQRLIYLKANASSDFWDEHWNEQTKARLLRNLPKHRFVCSVTRRYLTTGARILEGGLGLGDKVRALQVAGFRSTGVDFAKNTVAGVSEHFPELDVVEGDVMNLEYPDNLLKHTGFGPD